MEQSMENIGALIRDHKTRARTARYDPSFTLLSELVNLSILKLTQADHSKGLEDQGPWSSSEDE